MTRRRTFIEAHQLAPWFEAVNALREHPWGSAQQTVGDFLILLLLTGLRRNEAATLQWQSVDLKARLIRLPDTKNHDDHVLPLSDYLWELLSAAQSGSPAGVGHFGTGQKPLCVSGRQPQRLPQRATCLC